MRALLVIALVAGTGACGDLEEDPDPTGTLTLTPTYQAAQVNQVVSIEATFNWVDAASAQLITTTDSTAVAIVDQVTDVTATSGSDGVEVECVEAGEAVVTVELVGLVDDMGSINRSELSSRTATIVCGTPVADNTGDCMYSISTVPGTFCSPFLDIVFHSAGVIDVTEDIANDIEAEEADCDGACFEDSDEFPVGEAIFVTTTHDGDVPAADSGHSLIYSLVFDSDGDPTNNWVTQGEFDWDFFQGADLWLQAIWDHQTGQWSVTATQVANDQSTSQVPTAARPFFRSNSVHWLIPRLELSGAAPTYRSTAFGHDGFFSRTDSGGDVSAIDPTAPLTLVPL